MAIAFDNVLQTNSSSTSYSYTTSGSNRFLILTIVTGTVTACSATYGGVSLTLQKNQQWAAQSNWTQVLTLVNPASGANTLAITGSPLISTVVSYTGVSQTGQPEVTASKGQTSATSVSESITTLADNDWVFATFGNNAGTPAGYTNVTQRGTSLNNGLDVGDNNSPVHPAGSLTQGASQGGATVWSMVQIAFAPATAVVVNSNFLTFF